MAITGLSTTGGVSLDGLGVGWNTNGSGNTALEDYLVWGGDNTSSGLESAYFNFQNISSQENYPNLNPISEYNLYAAWYDSFVDGVVTVEIVAYIGGRMVNNNNDFVNGSATEVFKQTYRCVVNSYGGESQSADFQNNYTKLGKITYNKSDGSINIDMATEDGISQISSKVRGINPHNSKKHK